MRTFLTIIGSILILSATSAYAEEKKPTQNISVKHSSIVAPQVVDLKKDSSEISPALRGNHSQVPNLKELEKFRKEIKMGGATSGGGDDTGLEVQRVLGTISQMIENDSELYSVAIKKSLLEKARSAKIFVTEEELPTNLGNLSQYGAAFSIFDGKESVILIQRQRWTAIDSPVIKDSLIHHELAVLAGLETTGDYQYTNKFSSVRAKFWEFLRSQKFVCTFSIYDKATIPDWIMGTNLAANLSNNIGKLLGSAGVVMNNVGSTSSNWAVIYDLEPQVDGQSNKAVIVRYVISTNGYLKAEVSEANVKREKQNGWKIFSNLSKNSQARIYFSPYDYLDAGRSANLETWEDRFIQVACSKL